MYVIKMNTDQSLTTSHQSRIYQNDIAANVITFLIPMTCNNVDMSDQDIYVKYIKSNGQGSSEKLINSKKEYKGYYLYNTDKTSSITSLPGDVEVWLTAFSKIGDIVANTSSTHINITSSKNIADYFPEETSNQFDKIVSQVTKNKLNINNILEEIKDTMSSDEIDLICKDIEL